MKSLQEWIFSNITGQMKTLNTVPIIQITCSVNQKTFSTFTGYIFLSRQCNDQLMRNLDSLCIRGKCASCLLSLPPSLTVAIISIENLQYYNKDLCGRSFFALTIPAPHVFLFWEVKVDYLVNFLLEQLK